VPSTISGRKVIGADFSKNILMFVSQAPGQPQLSDETLFYTFYSMPGDINQLAAAAALYEHGWRYHKEQKVWITRSPGVEPSVRTGTYEEGTYIYFDIREWKKITKVFHLQYDQLEERKSTPAAPPGP
jgi:CCR4-NOT transcription complex subunit 2